MITMVFSDPPSNQNGLINRMKNKSIKEQNQTSRRRLSVSTDVSPSTQVALYDDNVTKPKIYDEYKTFNVELSSTQADLDPVEVKWSIMDFDG